MCQFICFIFFFLGGGESWREWFGHGAAEGHGAVAVWECMFTLMASPVLISGVLTT